MIIPLYLTFAREEKKYIRTSMRHLWEYWRNVLTFCVKYAHNAYTFFFNSTHAQITYMLKIQKLPGKDRSMYDVRDVGDTDPIWFWQHKCSQINSTLGAIDWMTHVPPRKKCRSLFDLSALVRREREAYRSMPTRTSALPATEARSKPPRQTGRCRLSGWLNPFLHGRESVPWIDKCRSADKVHTTQAFRKESKQLDGRSADR